MPEIKIKIADDVHKKLKQKAKEEMRSLTNFLTYHIGDLVNDNIININLENMPENTKITTKTQKPLTPDEIEEQQINAFQKRAKAILGRELDISRCMLTPDNNYYEFAEPREGRFTRGAYTMPIEKQKEYIEEWKHYLDTE